MINETQRKHLMKRIEAIRVAKHSELLSKYGSKVNNEDQYSPEARMAYIKSELERVGLNWYYDKWGKLVTPLDEERDAKYQAGVKLVAEKKKEFNQQVDRLLDKVILGDDAAELGAALEALVNFE